jgi:hypothetical protein
MIELAREGFDNPKDKPRRYFRLLKARRQPARIGAHVFHLKGNGGFRLKPSADARSQAAKSELWWDPDPRAEIFLTDDPPAGFRQHDSKQTYANALPIRNFGQILVIGKGSSGKAGFGLYLLHRRWFDRRMFLDKRILQEDLLQLPLLEDQAHQNIPAQLEHALAKKQAIEDASMFVPLESPFLETRVLVISFLYQRSYYDVLTIRLAARRRGKPTRKHGYGSAEKLTSMEFSPLPDRMRTDTIELYPGLLSVEDFIAKVEKALELAEADGLPYTGVLIDGLHNVFVQFPALENESSFWGMFYNILRRRRVTVVTTHTEFDIQGDSTGGNFTRDSGSASLVYDFEQAQRKMAPLLSAIVSASDYMFELSARNEGRRVRYQVTPLGAVGYDIGGITFEWQKERLRLEGRVGSLEVTSRRPALEPRTQDVGSFATFAVGVLDGMQKLARAISKLEASGTRKK